MAVRSANAWVSSVVPKSKRTAALEAQAVADFKTAQPPRLTLLATHTLLVGRTG